ncbi:MAG: hypothetical protein AAGA77_18160 [Bacteroidota bacterium]
MKKISLSVFILLILMIGVSFAEIAKNENENATSNQESKTQTSGEAFDKMMQVLMHERCVNCHPAGDKPLKGGDSHVTRSLGLPRGEDGHGPRGINCTTCHTDENNDFSGVPGAPHWALAPESMAWEGKTRVEIAQQMMDPERNGGRSHHDIMEHLIEHELVLWAWDPGVDAEGIPREKPPVSKEDFIAAVKEWINNGAVIPEQ